MHCIHVHTYIHEFINTCMYTYVHTSIHTSHILQQRRCVNVSAQRVSCRSFYGFDIFFKEFAEHVAGGVFYSALESMWFVMSLEAGACILHLFYAGRLSHLNLVSFACVGFDVDAASALVCFSSSSEQ